MTMKEAKKNHKIIGIIVAIIIAVAAAIIIYMQTSGKESKVQKDLELASQYLDELEYEQAIVVYEQVLSVDPKNKEALVGGARAYTGLAEQQEDAEQAIQDIEQAVAYAEQAYNLYPEEVVVQEVIVTAYIQTGDLCGNAKKYEKAVSYYEKAVSLELDESLEEKQEEAARKTEEAKELLEEQRRQEEAAERAKEYEVLLKPVLETWQSGDMEEVKRLIRQDEYNQMAETLGEGESYYCGEYDENGEQSGVGVGVYKVHDYYAGDIPFYYIGEWKNDVREGQADWIYSIDEGYGGVYQCVWINDFPEGDVICTYDIDQTVELDSWPVSYEMKGNLTHGLYNTKTDTTIWRSGEVTTDTYTYNKGYFDVLYKIDDPDDPYPYVVSSSEHCCSEEGLHLTRGIPGFADTWN